VIKRTTTHGGKRPGAGRKAGPEGPRAATLNVRITAAQSAALDAAAASASLTRSGVIAAWLEGLVRRGSKAARA
jgi:hypothetical protein